MPAGGGASCDGRIPANALSWSSYCTVSASEADPAISIIIGAGVPDDAPDAGDAYGRAALPPLLGEMLAERIAELVPLLLGGFPPELSDADMTSAREEPAELAQSCNLPTALRTRAGIATAFVILSSVFPLPDSGETAEEADIVNAGDEDDASAIAQESKQMAGLGHQAADTADNLSVVTYPSGYAMDDHGWSQAAEQRGLGDPFQLIQALRATGYQTPEADGQPDSVAQVWGERG